MSETEYYSEFAAAFVRGRMGGEPGLEASRALFQDELSSLTEDERQHLMEFGKARGLKLHKFKKTMGLTRIRAVLGILRGLQPASVLDVGSGRGVFLWPFLDEFPIVPITCLDQNPQRVRDISAVRDGGIERLNAFVADITKLELPQLPQLSERSFDVVTFLEALEHIPDAQTALNKALAMAKRAIILSVPSHEDDNEEHIHLFNQDTVASMLSRAGAQHTNFSFVLNHMIVVAKVSP